MSKEPSKTDQLRALREAKAAKPKPFSRDDQRLIPIEAIFHPKPSASEAKRPEGRHESAQPLKLGVDDEDEAPRKRKAKVAELQGKAESVKVKAARPQSRAGKKAATIWLTPDEMKRLQRASLDHEVPQERILAEGLAVMLSGKYKL